MVCLILASMNTASWLFDEAWAHRHSRRRITAAPAMGVACAAAAGFLLGRAQAPTSSGAHVTIAAPSTVLTQAPYMGVHCPVANSIACDRVGLAVVLRRPAQSVIATIDGRRLDMDRRGDVPAAGVRPRREFDGFLQPAGIRTRMRVRTAPGSNFWAPDVRWPQAGAEVRLLIDYGSGRIVLTQLHVPLSAGWG